MVPPSPPPPPPTYLGDINALLAIQAYFNASERLNWNRSIDPCGEDTSWKNVACSCNGFGPTVYEEYIHCDNYTANPRRSRVVYLTLDGGANEIDKFKGSIPDEIGRLKKLRWLSLKNNDLDGVIPDSFRNLKQLRYLSLANNRLSGTVPHFFSSYKHLMSIYLHHNNFSGSLADDWCRKRNNQQTNNVTAGSIYQNNYMCGEHPSILHTLVLANSVSGKLPSCLTDVMQNLNETYLYIQSNDSSIAKAPTECDATPPICQEDVNGCKLSVPSFWNREDVIFNYTSFTDPETGISHYEFRIIRVVVVNATSNDRFTVGVKNLAEITPKTVILKNNVSFETNVTKVTFNSTDSEKGLLDGLRYKVELTAFNFGGPPLNTTINSTEVLVDRSPPEIQAVYNNDMNETISKVSDQSVASASWNGVVDVHSDVLKISMINVFLELRNETLSENGTRNYTVVSSYNFNTLNVTSCKFSEVQLQAERTYRVRLRAINGVGLTREKESTPFTVYAEESNGWLGPNSSGYIALICIATALVALMLLMSCIIVARKKTCRTDSFEPDVYLRDILYEVSDVKDIRARRHEALDFDKDIAVVVTNIDDLTVKSDVDGKTYEKLMNIHNKLMLDAVRECFGCEITIEEDSSYSFAFPSVILAVCFALKVQEDFLREEWPNDVLMLPSCAAVKDSSGKLVTNGPRIQIGIHWAKKPGIGSVYHQVKGSRIFTGPEIDFIKQVAITSNGGQILMTHQAWLELYPYLSHCKFPIVSHIGVYSVISSRDPQPLYDVSCQFGRGSFNHIPALRRVRMVAKGRSLGTIPIPARTPDGTLTFVGVCMKKFQKKYDLLPVDLAEEVCHLLATRAQLFQGSVIKEQTNNVRLLIVFQDPLNAIRFTHITQISLVLTKWSSELLNFCGPKIPGEYDIPLFNGPRVAMAIHTTEDFVLNENCGSQPEDEFGFSVNCEGPGVEFVQRLSEILDGGQVVLSERSWSLTQNTLPGQYIVINHGKHKIHASYGYHTLLVELTPMSLRGRKFKRIESATQSEKGYFDSPRIENRMAILFVEVPAPREMSFATTEQEETNNRSMSSVMEAVFFEAVGQFTFCLRNLLRNFNGYECKEMERGKFVLAFEELPEAIMYSCQLQAEMFYFEWSEALLRIEEFSIRRCAETNRIIKRGLVAKISIAYGYAGHKEPTNIGRADYFGVLPNLSARLLHMASPGQILIWSEIGMDSCGIKWISQDSVGILSRELDDKNKDSTSNGIAIEILKLGDFLVRGMKELKRLYQARVSFLVGLDEDRGNPMLSSQQNNNGTNRHYRRWLHATTSRFRDNYQRLLFSNSFSTRRGGGGGNRLQLLNTQPLHRQMELLRQTNFGTHGILRNSPHSFGNGCGFRSPPDVQLRNISRPSSSGSRHLDGG
eukprot:g4164.t1